MPFICGNAYLLKCHFTKPYPKEKYAICVSKEKPLFFLISSNPRTRFNTISQLQVTPSDLSFLSQESYINTAEVITCVIPHSCNVLRDYGPVPDHIKQQIKSLVSNSDTLPERFIDTIISKL